MFLSMAKEHLRRVARLMDSTRRGRQQDQGSTLDLREPIAEHLQDSDRPIPMAPTNHLNSAANRIRTLSSSTTMSPLSDDFSSLFVLPLSTLLRLSSRNARNSLLEELALVLTFDNSINYNNKVLRNGSSFTLPVSLTTKRSKRSSPMLSLRLAHPHFPKFSSYRNQQDLVVSSPHSGQLSNVQLSTLSFLRSLLLLPLPVFSTGLLDYLQHSQRRTTSTLVVRTVPEARQEKRTLERLSANLEPLLPTSPPRVTVSLSPLISILLLLSARTTNHKIPTSRVSPRSSKRRLQVKEWSYNHPMDALVSSSNLKLDLHDRSLQRRRQQANRWSEIELPLTDFETKVPTSPTPIPHLLLRESLPLLLTKSVSVLRVLDANQATLRIITRTQLVQ